MILPVHKRMILWGLTDGFDSFRHIHRHFAQALDQLGALWEWMPDVPESRWKLLPGDVVFAADMASENLGLPVPGVDYLLHNMDASHPVFDGLEPERMVRLQVYTVDADQYGEPWGDFRRYDRESRTLFQPWGTNLLPDEFYTPVFNADAKQTAFVGSVWDDGGLGNSTVFRELTRVVESHGLTVEHLYHVSDRENVDAVRRSRFAPAVAGQWQCEKNYLPCRVFKNVSYGALGVTNVPAFHRVFGDAAVVEDSIEALIDRVLRLSRDDYLELTREQQRLVADDYTYQHSLLYIEKAFQEGR